jgi:cobyrinic acid a,c-diamide synthase
MAGVLPVRARMHRRPVGHGYCVAQVEEDNPFFPRGQILSGIEVIEIVPILLHNAPQAAQGIQRDKPFRRR